MTWLGYTVSVVQLWEVRTYSLFWRWDSSQMDNGVDTLEQRILLHELSNDLSVVGQIGSNEFGSHISFGRCRSNEIH